MNKKVVTFLSVSLGVLILIAIIFARKEPREPIIFSEESGSYPERSLDDLIYEADAVVVGEFESALPSKWSTPNGKLPEGATAETVFGNLYIYTEYIFRVESLLKGNQPESTVLIRTFGGQVGEDIMTVNSNETYQIGQTYLLFLFYDPRLAKDGDPDPFLVFGQRVYTVTDGKAASVEDEWNAEELSDYITNSPFAGTTVNIPDTLEANKIMQVIKIAADLEVNAKNSFDPTKFSEVFINDARFPLNADALEFVRTATNDPLLETAGFLDYKIARYKNWEIPHNGAIPLESIWINFISINVNDDTATAIFEIGARGNSELTLVLVDKNWYITGSWGLTTYENGSAPSAMAPGLENTPEIQEVIKSIRAAYDIEAEAIYTLDFTKLPEVFINDSRYEIDSDMLEVVKRAMNDPLLESAGFLDYKLAYYRQWISRPEWSKSPFSELILQFLSVQINGDTSTVYLHDGYRAVIVFLVLIDQEWYVAGIKQT